MTSSASPTMHVAKDMNSEDVSPLFPSLFPSSLGADRGTVCCIPSPYADSGHSEASFYGPSVQETTAMASPLSPPLFWTSHNPHTVPALSLHCPPALPCREPLIHTAWVNTRLHSVGQHGSFQSHSFVKRPETSDDALNSSSSSSGALTQSDTHFCVVCHDYASGYHYGVWSCEGCKAFFKRSIQGHNDYICPATNQCTIDKNRRKSCQACRLRKCYEVGMMKCGKSPCPTSVCGFFHTLTNKLGVSVSSLHSKSAPVLYLRLTPGTSQVHDASGVVIGAPVTVGPPRSETDRVPAESGFLGFSPEQLVHCILEAEPPQICLRQQMNKPYTESAVMMSLTQLADKELVLMISWAKKIPGFVELSLAHQVHLLECCWLEVLMLGLMWRSIDHPGKLIFSPDLKLNREEGSCVEGIMEIFDMLLAGSSRFRELRLQKEEYVCLKALILLNSTVTSSEREKELESRTKVLRLLDHVTDALVWSISRTGLSTQQQSTRLAHLLMLLSHIRHLSNKGMEHLSSMKRKNVVLLYDLLLEMLDANTPHSRRVSGSRDAAPDTNADLGVVTPPDELALSSFHRPVDHHLSQVNESQCSQE